MQANHYNSKEAIEARLKDGNRAELSAAELSDMKASLLEYADFHHADFSQPSVNFSYQWIRVFGGAMATIVLVVGTTSFFALESLPGEVLYSAKVRVLEPTLASIDQSPLSSLEKQTSLMERRLMEVKALEEQGLLTDEVGVIVADLVAENLVAFENALNDEYGQGHDSTEKLKLFDRTQAIIEAQEIIFDTDETSSSSDTFAELGAELDLLQIDTVEALLEAGAASSVAEYIYESIESIEEKITTGDYATSTLEAVELYVDNAAVNLDEMTLQETQENVAEASQAILTEEYLEADI